MAIEVTLEEFFAGQEEAWRLFQVVRERIARLGDADMKVTKSQVAFRRRRAFAWAWRPGQYRQGRGAPLVLSVSLPHRDPSPRWKEVIEPSPGRFMHHLELREPAAIDDQVEGWLREAWLHSG